MNDHQAQLQALLHYLEGDAPLGMALAATFVLQNRGPYNGKQWCKSVSRLAKLYTRLWTLTAQEQDRYHYLVDGRLI